MISKTHLALRTVLVVDALVFFAAAAMNFGLGLSVAGSELRFEQPIWQAGIGEAVIGVVLGAAGLTGRVTLTWIAFAASVLGIAFGLSSRRVEGLAREIHIVLVPLAILVLALLLLLLAARRRTAARGGRA